MWCLQATTLIQEASMLGTDIKEKFLPRDHDILAGLDVDKTHTDVTFTDHSHLMKSMEMPTGNQT